MLKTMNKIVVLLSIITALGLSLGHIGRYPDDITIDTFTGILSIWIMPFITLIVSIVALTINIKNKKKWEMILLIINLLITIAFIVLILMVEVLDVQIGEVEIFSTSFASYLSYHNIIWLLIGIAIASIINSIILLIVNRKNEANKNVITTIILILSFILLIYITLIPVIRVGICRIKYTEKYFAKFESSGIPLATLENEKWGYIDSTGKTIIEHKYDEASGFFSIQKGNVKLNVGAVIQKNKYHLILDDGTKIYSMNIGGTYKNLDRSLAITRELMGETDGLISVPAEINEVDKELVINSKKKFNTLHEIENNVYKYDDEHYICVEYETQPTGYDTEMFSEILQNDLLTQNAKYYIIKKSDYIEKNLNNRIQLQCDKLPIYYDWFTEKKEIRIYENGLIPYKNNIIEIENERYISEQGWFDIEGGKSQLNGFYTLLDVTDNYIMVRDHIDESTYFINYSGEKITDKFTEVKIIVNDTYIVKLGDEIFVLKWDGRFKTLEMNVSSISDIELLYNSLLVVTDINDKNMIYNLKGEYLRTVTDYLGTSPSYNIEIEDFFDHAWYSNVIRNTIYCWEQLDIMLYNYESNTFAVKINGDQNSISIVYCYENTTSKLAIPNKIYGFEVKEIMDDAFRNVENDDFTIYCEAGSYAEQYAKRYGFKYVIISPTEDSYNPISST